jgi:hypothetical protein
MMERAIRLTQENGTNVEFTAAILANQFRVPSQVKGTSLDEITIVREFLDIFTKESPGMPPHQDIEFLIEFLLGTPLISKRSYRMPMNELVELKKQIADLQAKGFIRPSSSPWGAPVTMLEH